MFPSSLLPRLASYLFGDSKFIYSEGWRILDTILTVPLPYLLTVAQYFFLGKLIDYLLRSRAVPTKQIQWGCIGSLWVMQL